DGEHGLGDFQHVRILIALTAPRRWTTRRDCFPNGISRTGGTANSTPLIFDMNRLPMFPEKR
ncbi:hypothetical protein, partial [Burkholderia sp. BCC1970]|uniref:hypothetical protein n=1 Tax=Burkholderia sp. BCC1970 TaxID=2817437 RepID=UPI002ABE8074